MLSLIQQVSHNQKRKIVFLSLLVLISNLLEGAGISLIIPVFQKLLGQSSLDNPFNASISLFLMKMGVTPSLVNILILLNVAFICKTLMSVLAKFYSTRIAAEYLKHIQKDLFKLLLDARISLFYNEKHGKLVNSLTTEIVRTSNVFVQVANWISNLITIFVYLFISFKISSKLAFIALVLGLICIGPLRYVNKLATGFGAKWSMLNEEIQNLINETFIGIKFIKASNYNKQSVKKFESLADRYCENWVVMVFNSNLAALFSHPIGVFILSVLLYLSVNYSINLPVLVLFLLSFLRMLPTMTALSGIRNDINSNVSGLMKIEELKKLVIENKEDENGAVKIEFRKSIEFEKVKFRYHKSTPLIENLSYKINFGDVVAVTGVSGGGKTTLVDLILKLYQVQGGQILIDGVSAADIDTFYFRNQVAYVSQETFLLHSSVKDNILLGNPDATELEIREALHLAHADEFTDALENGIDTIIGSRGSKLSGGQKQRIALARALVKKPKLLILDEATSALDLQSEEAIRETIHFLKSKREMTIILIAHRPSTIQEADHILNINGSK